MNKFLNSAQKWHLGSAIFLFVSLFYLDSHSRYYFLQDDTFSQFFPVILEGYRDFFRTGKFPLWNPYQFMGMPVFDTSTYALSYPLLFLAYCLARFVMFDEMHTITVMFVIHAVPAYYFLNRILKHQGVERYIRVPCALTLIFSGYYLVVGRSWYYALPTMMFMPFLIFQVMNFHKTTIWRWVVTTGIAVGLYYHSGNAQYMFYTLILFGIAVAVHAFFEKSLKIPIAAALSGLLSAVIALPALFPQLAFLKEVSRERLARGFDQELLSFIIPPPWAPVPKWFHFHFQNPGEHALTFYGGTFFVLLGLAAPIYFLWKKYRPAPVFASLLAAFIIFLDYGMGDKGFTWGISAYLPVIKNFNFVHKITPYVIFCINILGALALSRFITNYLGKQPEKERILKPVVALLALLPVIYTVTHAHTSYYTFADRSYDLSEVRLQHVDPKQRMLAISDDRSFAKGFVDSFMLNFPTPNQVYALNFYDPLVNNIVLAQSQLQRAIWKLKNTGVFIAQRYIKLKEMRTLTEYEIRQNPAKKALDSTVKEVAPILSQMGVSTILFGTQYNMASEKLSNYTEEAIRPLVYFDESPKGEGNLEWMVDWQGITVNTAGKSGQLVLNFWGWEPFKVFHDGQQKDHRLDHYQRMIIDVDQGTRQVRAQYIYPLGTVALGCVVIFTFWLLLTYVFVRFQKGDSSP